MVKRSNKQIQDDFNKILIQTVINNPPKNFNSDYFMLLVLSGRTDEASAYLQNLQVS
jgi:hypothetical protein